MNDEYCITNKVYDGRLYDSLVKKYWQKEPPKEIKDYMTFCYHYEEYNVYGEV